METKIKSVKVWSKVWSGGKKEFRIYVSTMDGRSGCNYLTGNPYQKAGSLEGNLTAEDWQEAERVAVIGGQWTTQYESYLHGQPSNRRVRCPDCGGYTCGSNCHINHPNFHG